MSTPTPRTDTEITFTGAYTCTNHNDQQRAACPVCLVTALTAERDQLRAEVERTDALYQRACEVEHELRAEVERLRSNRDCEKRLRKDAEELREDALERALKSEADLAAAKERLRSEAMDDYASIKDLQRELTAERARLNCLQDAVVEIVWDRQVPGVMRGEDGHCYYKESLRAAIDEAMKEDAK